MAACVGGGGATGVGVGSGVSADGVSSPAPGGIGDGLVGGCGVLIGAGGGIGCGGVASSVYCLGIRRALLPCGSPSSRTLTMTLYEPGATPPPLEASLNAATSKLPSGFTNPQPWYRPWTDSPTGRNVTMPPVNG